jgi:hypothetical protein
MPPKNHHPKSHSGGGQVQKCERHSDRLIGMFSPFCLLDRTLLRSITIDSIICVDSNFYQCLDQSIKCFRHRLCLNLTKKTCPMQDPITFDPPRRLNRFPRPRMRSRPKALRNARRRVSQQTEHSCSALRHQTYCALAQSGGDPLCTRFLRVFVRLRNEAG